MAVDRELELQNEEERGSKPSRCPLIEEHISIEDYCSGSGSPGWLCRSRRMLRLIVIGHEAWEAVAKVASTIISLAVEVWEGLEYIVIGIDMHSSPRSLPSKEWLLDFLPRDERSGSNRYNKSKRYNAPCILLLRLQWRYEFQTLLLLRDKN